MELKAATAKHLTMPTAEPVHEMAIITPAVAKELAALRDDSRNRTYSAASGNAYLADMLAGRWAFTGDPIRFDTDGKMIDGQHRTAAVAQLPADHPGFPFIIVRGVEREAQDVMDSGRPRKFADQINIGVEDPKDKVGTKVVSALRALYILGSAGSAGKLGGGRLSNAQLKALYLKHPAIVDSVKLVAKGERAMKTRTAVVAAIHYIGTHMTKGTKGKAEAFVKAMASLVPTPEYKGETDPAHQLEANWDSQKALGIKGARVSENEALKLVAAAWNAYTEGQAAPNWKAVTKSKVVNPVGIKVSDVTGEAEPEVAPPKAKAPKASKKPAKASPAPAEGDAPKAKPKAASKAPKGKAKGKGKAKEPTLAETLAEGWNGVKSSTAKAPSVRKASRAGNTEDEQRDDRNKPLAERVAGAGTIARAVTDKDGKLVDVTIEQQQPKEGDKLTLGM